MTLHDYVRSYIARKKRLPATEIMSFRLEAFERQEWSEETIDSFHCLLHFTLRDGSSSWIAMEESEVVAFLNGFAGSM